MKLLRYLFFCTFLLGAYALNFAFAEPKEYEVLFSIPIGDVGIHYRDEGIPELEAWGPAAFTVASDGTFWIADTADQRVLQISANGAINQTVDMKKNLIVPTDIEVAGPDLFVLDQVSTPPKVLRFSTQGELQVSTLLPVQVRDRGLSGISIKNNKEIYIEFHGGTFFAPLGDPLNFTTSFKDQGVLLDFKAPTDVFVNSKKLDIMVEHKVGGTEILRVQSNGTIFMRVEEVVSLPEIRVDVTVRKYNAVGKLIGIARVPISERYVYTQQDVAVSLEGIAYALIPRKDIVDVAQLTFFASLKSNVGQFQSSPNEAPIPLSTFDSGNNEQPELPSVKTDLNLKPKDVQTAPFTDSTKRLDVPPTITQPPSALSERATSDCRKRSDMEQTAVEYKENKTILNDTNIKGDCNGRGTPRYLGAAGEYSSVSYDWGGWDPIKDFNNFMTSGKQAGDIDTKIEEDCSKGVDCSGFVSRCWALRTKHSTNDLVYISDPIPMDALQIGDILNKPGSHVVLFKKQSGNDIEAYEATTYQQNDRVIFLPSRKSRFNGYTPRRYKNVCL